ncbi:sensor histidine kinase [Streptosporangium carneum]|uniref:sensor histidine kinase n=1 Tax=Streptosporangium carneum TaxID=47481 RepID=UPI0022F34899|nr:nitrate- and nitrite sensing domain-containing protein [Streptosporangium carneum]
MWGFALNLTVGDGAALLRSNSLYQTVGLTSTELGLQLQAERTQSSVAISSRVLTSGIGDQRGRTDRAVEKFRTAALADDSGSPEIRTALHGVLRQVDRLAIIRSGIDSGRHSRLEVLSNYNQILDSVFLLYDQLVAVPDLGIYQQAAAMQSMGNAREMIARENALISGALINYRLSAQEREAFSEYASTRRYLHARGLSALDSELGKPYRDTFDSTAFERFVAMEKAITGATGGRLPVEAERWKQTTNGLSTWLDQLGVASSNILSERSQSVATGIMVRIAVAGGLGLLAVIASIILSVRFGRRLASELADLRSAALDLADVRLPHVVERLRRGEEVDVPTEVPPINVGGSTEVKDVAHAFDSVRRTAVEAAVGQANLRRGVSHVFVNLARRKQSLLQRQLTLLDSMQRRSTDPDSLDDLFRLDHLTTRMRRHAEGLIILSGAAPGRAWRNPVAVVDIVRAAIAEVEDYTRVSVAPLPNAALDGAAVADITHLIAELIENATIYSPAQTTVTVRGDVVANGFALEVEDRGLGLRAEEYEALNERLANPPEFDLADSDKLGLFVVGQLAARHGIRVILRGSPFGGTTAIALIPRAVLADASAPLTLTAERVDEHPADAAELFESGVPSALTAAPASPGDASGSGFPGDGASHAASRTTGPRNGVSGNGTSRNGAAGGGLPRRTRTTPSGPSAPSTGSPAAPAAPPVLSPASAGRTSPGDHPLAAPTLSVVADTSTRRAALGGLSDASGDRAPGTSREPASGSPGTRPLPRRVRQANLAPQLRQETSQPPAEPAPEAAERSPDETRALFSAFQAGARRGREEDGNDFPHQTTGDKGD